MDYAPIPVAQFGDYVAGLHANNNKKIKDLYKVLSLCVLMCTVNVCACVCVCVCAGGGNL